MAYVPNAKLILTDDHKFLNVIAEQKGVKELFWEVSQLTFKVALRMEISVAKNEILGLYI